jgi:mercuric ion transport protein
MAVQNDSALQAKTEAARDAAKALLTAGALVAAFGVASCCALPIALSLVGASASLLGIGYLAAPYQPILFYVAVAFLGGAATIMWRQYRRRACAADPACIRPVLDWSSKLAFALAIGLLALTFWIEPPI